jgi:hypothetical protein
MRLKAFRPVAVGLLALVLTGPLAWAFAQAVPAEGIELYRAGRYAQALSVFLKAVEASPADSAAWTWLGATYFYLNRLREAVLALRRAIELDPRNPAAPLFLGLTYLQLGDTVRARESFQRTQSLSPGTVYARAAAAWLQTIVLPTPEPRTGSCPSVPAVVIRRPDVVESPGDAVQFASTDISIIGGMLVVSGEVTNVSERTIRNVRIEVTGFALNGQPAAHTALVLPGDMDLDDLREFSFRLDVNPPPLWVYLRVTGHSGRPPEERLPSFLLSVPVDLYESVAPQRVKVRATAVPSAPARSHTLCVWISDTGGLPVDRVRVRIAVEGNTQAQAVRHERLMEIDTTSAASFDVRWPALARPSVQATVESIKLSQPTP